MWERDRARGNTRSLFLSELATNVLFITLTPALSHQGRGGFSQEHPQRKLSLSPVATMSFYAVKMLHIACVIASFALFFLRGVWMITESPLLQRRWVKIAPHVNDTLLLIAGLSMAFMIRQYPFIDGWLTAKVFGLIAYILVGTIGLKRGKTKSVRIGFWIAAQVVFLYIVSVALTRSVNPFAALL